MNLENVNKKYIFDKNLVHSCQYHVIFTPKYRRKVLTDEISERLKELIIEKQGEYKYQIIEMEIMSDHVHLLIQCSPRIGIYTLVNHIKGYTSNVLRKEFPKLKSRIPTLWTRSKFISSVGTVSLEVVKKYIEDQKNI